MTTSDLEALVKAWDEGIPSAGMALHDAMEEANWPWKWRPRDDQPSRDFETLYLPGNYNAWFVACTGSRNGFDRDIRWAVWSCSNPMEWKSKDLDGDENCWPSFEERKRRCEEELKKILQNS